MLKKSFISLMSLIMLLSVFAGFGGNKASANTTEEMIVLNSVSFDNRIITDPINPGGVETNSVPSYAVKKALGWAIDNTTSITNYIGKIFGKNAATSVGNVMHDYIKPALRKLEKMENVTYDKIEDTLTDVLQPVMGKTAGRISAGFIVTAIKVLSPV